MPLTLVLGPANSAKAGEVLGAYAGAARRRDALLVVPTAADALHYDRELAGAGATLGRALTFDRLLDELARRADFTARRLTPLQRRALLRTAVNAADLRALADSARASGFATAAGRLVAELGQARVTPARLAGALRAWAAADPARADYARDVAALYSTYVRQLERSGRLDDEAFAWGALDALRAQPGRWGGTPVYFYGFDDLTSVQHDTVETLASVAGAPVTVSLNYEPGRAAFAARANTAEELRAQADSVRELPAAADHYAPAGRTALHGLERGLFRAAAEREPIEPGNAVVLMEAGGERGEAELIASEVLDALREGVPPEELVVVCRSLARSGALLERVLRRYGVEASSARTLPFGHTGLGRALLGLARCALAPDAPAADLLAYLRHPGSRWGSAEVDALEAEASRRAVTSAAGAAALVAAERLSVLGTLREAADPAPVLEAVARQLVAEPDRGRGAVLDVGAELDARAGAAALGALGELRELEAPIPIADLLGLLDELPVPAARAPAAGTVLVAEPEAIRARRFRRVFVCGLCEGEFPAGSNLDPFLGEERRHELATSAGLLLTPSEDALSRERYLFYACVSRATERLVLSYRSSDEEGNLLLPSPFVADVADLFVPGWRDRRRRRLLGDVVWPAAEAPTAREQRLALAASGPSTEVPPLERRLGEAALGHARHLTVLSGGALESFAGCPVRWLVESQLQPEALEPEAEALTRGSFMHDVLERVLAGLGGPVTEASLPRAEELLDELAAQPPRALGAGRAPAVRAAVLRGIVADLRRYLRHEASDGCSWAPVALEQRFGFDDAEDGLPPLVLGQGQDEVRVRGVIDRIDVDPRDARRAIVRDYKSGAVRGDRCAAKWRDEHQLQVALYMLAARRLLALEPVGGFYQPLTGPTLRPRGAYRADADVGRCAYGNDALDAEELEKLLVDLEAQAVELAATLRRGELTPAPETCGRDGCRHPGICWVG